MTGLARNGPPPGQPCTKGNAVVRAGAGGIGSEIARRLKADGFRVFITDVDEEAGQRVRDELRVEFIQCDSASEPDMRHKRCDLGDTHRGLPPDTGGEHRLAHLHVAACRPRDDGATVRRDHHDRVRSGPDRQCGPLPYGISKWALPGLTKSLANQLAPWGIRANAVLPGIVAGERFEGSMTRHAEQEGISREEAFEWIMSRTRLKRFIDPSEVAGAGACLASDDAIGITGTFLDVSGGFE